MPYICLARSDVPNSTLQVLDLLPNSSQLIPSLSPPGESRYVNRVKVGTGIIDATGNLDGNNLDGLAAYLIDNVEPGGLQIASGTVTVLAGLAAGETLTINGVVFTAAAFGAGVAANRTFDSDVGVGSSIANTHATLVAAIIHADSIAAMKLGTIAGSYAGATGVSPVVTLTAKSGAGADLVGWAGNMTLAKSVGAHMTLSGARLTRGLETWTPVAQATATAAIVARVDSGSALALSDINTALSTVASMELTSAGGSASTGTVADVLACLAGRTYRISRVSFSGSVNQFMDATYPTFKTNTGAALGGFTESKYVNGDTMSHGEIKPSAIGGSVVQREIGGIRHTYNVDSVTASLVSGQLSKMTTPSLLWPTSNVFPHFPFGQDGFTQFDQITAPRLVTVYDDAGAVL